MKTYPFSMKHAHDIELYHNRLYNIMRDMESGEIPMDGELHDKIYDRLYNGDLADLMDAIYASRNPYVVQLTGPQIGLAKQVMLWASEFRANSCIKNGRYDLLRYC